MKLNELPEKIYIHPDNDVMGEVLSQKVEGDVEYIRTNAFIEKACDYLNKTCRKFILTEKDIEDFKNYMRE